MGTMIELRWLVRMIDRPRGIDDGMYQPPLPDKLETRVLQYRQRTNFSELEIWPIIWTDWQDVPTEPDASAEDKSK